MTHTSIRLSGSVVIAALMLLGPALAAAEPLTAPVAITQDGKTAGSVAMVKRSNGDLVAVFNSGAEPHGMFASVSKDRGRTWSAQTYVNSGWDRAALLENQNKQLVLVSNEGLGFSVSISDDGITWKSIGTISIMKPNYHIGDLMQAKDGSYYFTYSAYEVPENLMDMSVFVSRSMDLKGWSTPIRASKKNEGAFSSSLVRLKDGSFSLAYYSYPQKGIVMVKSKDGKTWTQPRKLVRLAPYGPVDLRLGILFGTPVLAFGDDHAVSTMSLKGTRWSRPKMFYKAVFEKAIVELDSKTLGIAFFPEPEGPRNIFFDTVQVR